jgi:hypothetical protein
MKIIFLLPDHKFSLWSQIRFFSTSFRKIQKWTFINVQK